MRTRIGIGAIGAKKKASTPRGTNIFAMIGEIRVFTILVPPMIIEEDAPLSIITPKQNPKIILTFFGGFEIYYDSAGRKKRGQARYSRRRYY